MSQTRHDPLFYNPENYQRHYHSNRTQSQLICFNENQITPHSNQIIPRYLYHMIKAIILRITAQLAIVAIRDMRHYISHDLANHAMYSFKTQFK